MKSRQNGPMHHCATVLVGKKEKETVSSNLPKMLYLMPPRTTTLLASPASMKIRPYKAFVAKKKPKRLFCITYFPFICIHFHTPEQNSPKM